ncbi:YciI family protein [Nocardia miyunensis]|uniref:YciI family protein n=1 Tax=Nocardia miyunensis TaxID=282684 RepID=UPI00082C6E5E|nr:YciI family protein [Nocardia miyunensis]
MSQYLVLIYQDERQVSEPAPGTPTMGSHQEFMQANQSALRGGNALAHSHSATSIRPDGAGGFTVTDGPFAETKEQLGGYYLIEADDLDAALEVAKQVPMAEGGVEVRPLLVLS